jgi:lipopolysaccharide/colanic/teichoic acid biosynthesis glycosyltransferase
MRLIKPIFDQLFSLFLLIILFPLLLFLSIILFIYFGNPFFLQERPGKFGKAFWVIKFKTMKNKYDDKGTLLPDNLRLTKIGKWIRDASIDELPQLLNVLKGDMSFIGPRPLLKQYLEIYNEYQMKRHDVKPGITGWAQVNGRNAISWKQKFEYDNWYVENVSFLVDMKVVILTVKNVINKKGIYKGEGIASMEMFNGKN